MLGGPEGTAYLRAKGILDPGTVNAWISLCANFSHDPSKPGKTGWEGRCKGEGRGRAGQPNIGLPMDDDDHDRDDSDEHGDYALDGNEEGDDYEDDDQS